MDAQEVRLLLVFLLALLLPLFFAISGLRTNVTRVRDPVTAGLLVLVFVMASFAKIMGTIIIAALYAMPFREGIALGFLMNTRGLVEMIVLNIGRDKQVTIFISRADLNNFNFQLASGRT